MNFDRNDEIQVKKNFYKKFKNLKSADECLNECIKEDTSCNVVTFSKGSQMCYLFQNLNSERVKNKDYVSFTRKTQHCKF